MLRTDTDLVEDVKDRIEKLDIDSNLKLELQQKLSLLRSQILGLNEAHRECFVRQNVYAEVAEKIWNRIVDRTYDRY